VRCRQEDLELVESEVGQSSDAVVEGMLPDKRKRVADKRLDHEEEPEVARTNVAA
jgi:hypothetical protein